MTLIGARRRRIELEVSPAKSTAWVHIQPVAYLGRQEFKQAIRMLRSLFMDLEDRRSRY